MRPLTSEQQALVVQWLPLVQKLANAQVRAQPRLMSYLEDLRQAGTEGLMRAVQKFDPSRKVLFYTYAFPWIQVTIREAGRKYLNVTRAAASGGQAGRKAQFDQRVDDFDVYADTRGGADAGTEDTVDAARMWPQALAEIQLFGASERDAAMYLRVVFGGEQLSRVGESYGVTRQRVKQIVDKTEAAFGAWAADIRQEAA